MRKEIAECLHNIADYISVEPMSWITKANLELLIREIQDLNPSEDIKALLESWIKGNGLHPEKIKSFNRIYYKEDVKR